MPLSGRCPEIELHLARSDPDFAAIEAPKAAGIEILCPRRDPNIRSGLALAKPAADVGAIDSKPPQ